MLDIIDLDALERMARDAKRDSRVRKGKASKFVIVHPDVVTFVETMKPDTVLALIERVRRAEDDLAAAEQAVDSWAYHCNAHCPGRQP